MFGWWSDLSTSNCWIRFERHVTGDPSPSRSPPPPWRIGRSVKISCSARSSSLSTCRPSRRPARLPNRRRISRLATTGGGGLDATTPVWRRRAQEQREAAAGADVADPSSSSTRLASHVARRVDLGQARPRVGRLRRPSRRSDEPPSPTAPCRRCSMHKAAEHSRGGTRSRARSRGGRVDRAAARHQSCRGACIALPNTISKFVHAMASRVGVGLLVALAVADGTRMHKAAEQGSSRRSRWRPNPPRRSA